MKHRMIRIWRDENGVLTFEWILLITVLVIGLTGGISAVRDALIDEMGDVSGGVVALDQSYWVNVPLRASIYDPITFPVSDYISGSANAYIINGSWQFFPSHYSDVAGTIWRGRPTDTGSDATGHRLTQEMHKKSSVEGE